MNPSAAKYPTLLLPQTISKRRLPVNFDASDLPLFSHELEQAIPATQLLELDDVRVSADGILFKGRQMLPESFAFPSNRELWHRRSLVKFFATNYLLRRTRNVEEPILWITDDWSNGYFHWLTDVLSRLYVVRDRLPEFLLALPWDFAERDFVKASLECFGVKSVKFIGKDEVWFCRKLVMPTHTAPSGHYNEETIRAVRRHLLQCFGAAPAQTYSRVYVSRGRARKRRILNEELVSEVLREFGFETIYAEDHSFAEQVRLCSQARYLVTNHGAGLTNMLFMPQGSGVLELRHQADAINNCYFTLASALDLNYFYQNCRSDNSNEDPHLADLVVDLETLRKNLRWLVAS